MKKYRVGESVDYGIYFCPRMLDLRFVGADTEMLDGKLGGEYFRIPSILLVAIAPIIGGVFVMAFPLMVVAMSVFAVLMAAGRAFAEASKSMAPLFDLRWQPLTAYLNRRKRTKTPGEVEPPLSEHELDELEREVEDRRTSEK